MKRKAWRTAPIAAGPLAAILFSRVPPVSAQSTEKPADQPGDQAATESGAPSHPGGLWQREMLTGDWGGLRTALEQKGLSLGANEIGEVLGNITGGIKRGTVFEGRLEMLVDLDLDKAVGWSGATFHANAYQIHGRGLSANDLGNNILIASGIEATRATRLFDLWLQQELFDGLLSIRIGQIAADDEFFVSQYAANFINSTFGWPDILATVLPSGGPAYPPPAPGAPVRLPPTSERAFAR